MKKPYDEGYFFEIQSSWRDAFLQTGVLANLDYVLLWYWQCHAFPKTPHQFYKKMVQRKDFASQSGLLLVQIVWLVSNFMYRRHSLALGITLHLGKGHIQECQQAFWPRRRLLRPVCLLLDSLEVARLGFCWLFYQLYGMRLLGKSCWTQNNAMRFGA